MDTSWGFEPWISAESGLIFDYSFSLLCKQCRDKYIFSITQQVSHRGRHTDLLDSHQALPIFFFIIIFFFISLISSLVLIVFSSESPFFPSLVQMSLVLVKVSLAMGLIGSLAKKGDPGWFGRLFVIGWIFSGGSVSILLSCNSIQNLIFLFSVEILHMYKNWKKNLPIHNILYKF